MRHCSRKKVGVISIPDQENVLRCRLLNYVSQRWEKKLRSQKES
jgi:hypothetical protein